MIDMSTNSKQDNLEIEQNENKEKYRHKRNNAEYVNSLDLKWLETRNEADTKSDL